MEVPNVSSGPISIWSSGGEEGPARDGAPGGRVCWAGRHVEPVSLLKSRAQLALWLGEHGASSPLRTGGTS